MIIKKIFLGAVLALCMDCFTLHAGLFDSNIDQNTREAAIANIVRAVAAEDVMTIYSLTAPDSRKKILDETGGLIAAYRKLNSLLAQSKKEMADKIKAKFGDAVDPEKFIIAVIDSSPEKLWDAYTPEHQQKLIASNGSKESARQQLELLIGLFRRTLLLEAGQKLANQLICIDGQWFLAPDTADRSSKEAVTAEFVKAVYVNNDMAALWQLFAPQLQNAQIKAYGSAANAQAAIRQKFLGKATAEQLAQLKKELQDKDFFAETVKKMLSRQKPDDLIQINGKWYINKL